MAEAPCTMCTHSSLPGQPRGLKVKWGGGALQMILTLKDREGRVPGTSSPACSESSRTLQTDELMLGENRNVFEEASLAA